MKQIPCKDCIALPACIIGPINDIIKYDDKIHNLIDKCYLIKDYLYKDLQSEFENIEKVMEFVLLISSNNIKSRTDHVVLSLNNTNTIGYYCIKNKRLVEVYHKTKSCPLCGKDLND